MKKGFLIILLNVCCWVVFAGTGALQNTLPDNRANEKTYFLTASKSCQPEIEIPQGGITIPLRQQNACGFIVSDRNHNHCGHHFLPGNGDADPDIEINYHLSHNYPSHNFW